MEKNLTKGNQHFNSISPIKDIILFCHNGCFYFQGQILFKFQSIRNKNLPFSDKQNQQGSLFKLGTYFLLTFVLVDLNDRYIPLFLCLVLKILGEKI